MKVTYYFLIVFAIGFAAAGIIYAANGLPWAIGGAGFLVCVMSAKELRDAAQREAIALNGYLQTIRTAALSTELLRQALDGKISSADITASAGCEEKNIDAARASMKLNVSIKGETETGRAAIDAAVRKHRLNVPIYLKVGEKQPPLKAGFR